MIKNKYEAVRGCFGLNFWAALAGNPNWSKIKAKENQNEKSLIFPQK